MNAATTIPLMVSIFLAMTGLAAKYLHDLHLARRKDRLERVDRQLRQLYGPLYALCHATGIAWIEFRKKFRPGIHYWDPASLPTPKEAEAWRTWMTEVFMPLNLEMERTITANADLLVDGEMPECFLRLCAHVAGYKPVLRAWSNQDYSVNASLIDFPRETLGPHVAERYRVLKATQQKLLGAAAAAVPPSEAVDVKIHALLMRSETPVQPSEPRPAEVALA